MTKHSLFTAALAGSLLAASSLYGAQIAAIDELPEKGSVTIRGEVASIDDETNFILRDGNGDTIDVETTKSQMLRKGDKVAVEGTVQSEALGMGQEIADATVTKLGSGETKY